MILLFKHTRLFIDSMIEQFSDEVIAFGVLRQ
ncbi:Uncharacterised protein [Vibrio cholerae]|nr:Uncharacterised protein [Vibrio cholerae]